MLYDKHGVNSRGLKDRVYEIQDSNVDKSVSSEKIISIAKDICLDRIKKTEEKIKKGDYSTKIKKHFWSPDEVYCSVYVDPIDYRVLANPEKPTPYYDRSRLYLKKEDEELFKSTIISMLEKEGFTCRCYEPSWGDPASICLDFKWKKK